MNNKNSGNLVIWLLMGVVILILVVGGMYYYINQNKDAYTTPTTGNTTYVQPSESTKGASLETQANAIDVNPDPGFDAVDKDLQSL